MSNTKQKIPSCDRIFVLEEPNGLDVHVPQAHNLQKTVATKSSKKCACKRIADAHVPFCERGGAR